MFESGLLVTFIPEILMVIGYLLCLIVPQHSTNNSPLEYTTTVAHVSTVERAQTSTYSVSITDFYDTAIIILVESVQFHAFVQKSLGYFSVTPFGISAGLTFIQFSRPPPSVIS